MYAGKRLTLSFDKNAANFNKQTTFTTTQPSQEGEVGEIYFLTRNQMYEHEIYIRMFD